MTAYIVVSESVCSVHIDKVSENDAACRQNLYMRSMIVSDVN